MNEFIIIVLYAFIPLPGLLYLGLAVYLRERVYCLAEDHNGFATVNGMLVSVALGAFIGVLPWFVYGIQFLTFLSSRIGPGPNVSLENGLLVGGLAVMLPISLFGSFKFRRLFQRRRIAYYLTSGIVSLPLVSVAYLLADYVRFCFHR
ncbi:MAG: hypothetical protein JXR91_07930 [Deltaproteobacteria bacterium]|nr:hypothetical protein [Deltaproteobacteria bacterium]